MKKNIMLLCFSIIFSLCIVEITLRCFDLTPTVASLRVGHYTLSDDPLLRFELLKNQEAYEGDNAPEYIFNDGVNWGGFHTNSFGFRDIERTIEKPDNITRIAVLGDSITMAINVDLKNRYTELLEDRLNDLAGPDEKYEVMNFGVSGYDMLQEAIILKRDVLRFNPDIVIFGYCLNDYNTLSDGGAFKMLIKQQKGKDRNWSRRLVNDNKVPVKRYLYKSALVKLILFAITASQGMDDSQLIDIDAEESRNLLDEACSRIEKARVQYGFRILIVIFPAFDKLSSYPYWPLHLMIKEKAMHYKWPFLDLHGHYLSLAKEDGKEFRDTPNDKIHPNARGHKIAAEAIASFLKKRILQNQ